MPLKIELKPGERLIIGNAAIRNGPRRASFIIETNTKFLRETEIVTQGEADTHCKKLYFSLTVMYLADDPAPAENAFVEQANELIAAVPSTAPYIRDIYAHIAAGAFYKALKRGKDLMLYEQSLAERLSERTLSAEPA